MSDLTCPTCGPVPSGECLGYVEQGVYDGILIWQCGSGHMWPRFHPHHPSGYSRLHDAAVASIAHRLATSPSPAPSTPSADGTQADSHDEESGSHPGRANGSDTTGEGVA